MYVKFAGYADGSENTQSRYSPWFRDLLSRFVIVLAQYRCTNYQLVYRSYKEEEEDEKKEDEKILRLYDDCIADEREIMEYLSNRIETSSETSTSILTSETTRTTTTTTITKTIKGKVGIFAAHPHGLVPSGSIMNAILTDKEEWKNGVTTCVHQHFFNVPILREFALALGLINVTRKNMLHQLKDVKQSIYLLPGGSREMIGNDIQRLHEGFLRMAYEEKFPVIAVLHFGQEDVFPTYTCWCLDWLRYFFLYMFGYPYPCFFIGPFKAQLTTVLLKPLSPLNYENVDDFIKSYYDTVITKYTMLKEKILLHTTMNMMKKTSIATTTTQTGWRFWNYTSFIEKLKEKLLY